MANTRIYGKTHDAAGRCQHWHSELDVVANLCIICDKFWACHECHAELTDHDFGRVDPSSTQAAVLCGACGVCLTAAKYFAAAYGEQAACPSCNHPFNPGCKTHKNLYFNDPNFV